MMTRAAVYLTLYPAIASCTICLYAVRCIPVLYDSSAAKTGRDSIQDALATAAAATVYLIVRAVPGVMSSARSCSISCEISQAQFS